MNYKEVLKSPLAKTIKRVMGARRGKPIIRSLFTSGLKTLHLDWNDPDPMDMSWSLTPQGELFWCNIHGIAVSKKLIEW